METIKDKIKRFYSLIENYSVEGGLNTRYKSWEWCHEAFINEKENYKATKDNKEKNKIIELLSLHLAFYLASWGMYRGSSFLLQRDYKAHKKAVEYILEDRYDILWNYVPDNSNIISAKELIFNKDEGIYWRIKQSYLPDIASETLITKILMGTYGCVPAFDRFLKKGISTYINNFSNKIGCHTLSCSIEHKHNDTFMALATLVINNRDSFELKGKITYPPMKCVDMYFWEIGYELGIADELVNAKNDNSKKSKLLEIVASLDLCDKGIPFEKASETIIEKNLRMN